MEVFLSWSGARSKLVAEALRGWLPGVLQSIEPWVSCADIEAGARWHQTLSARLMQCNFGVICLTPENLRSPWLLYESGALSKAVEHASVVPYLLGLRKADVSGPLAHFQSVEADQDGTLALLQAMNAVMTRLGIKPLPDEVLRNALRLWWPQLSAVLESARALDVKGEGKEAARTNDQMLQELVESTRGISVLVGALAGKLESTTPSLPIPPRSIAMEPEILEASRTVLSSLIADVEADTLNMSMERAVLDWELVVKDPQATLEKLNESIRSAKSLRAYLNR